MQRTKRISASTEDLAYAELDKLLATGVKVTSFTDRWAGSQFRINLICEEKNDQPPYQRDESF